MIQHLFMYDLLPGSLFYVLGACMALHMKDKINNPQNKSVAVAALAVFVITQVWRILIFDASIPIAVARTTLPYRTIELLGPIALWFAADLIPFKRIPILSIEKENFAVYVTHYMTVSVVTSTAVNSLLQLPTASLVYAVFMFFVTPLAIYILTVLVAGLIKKLVPNIYRVAMGGAIVHIYNMVVHICFSDDMYHG